MSFRLNAINDITGARLLGFHICHLLSSLNRLYFSGNGRQFWWNRVFLNLHLLYVTKLWRKLRGGKARSIGEAWASMAFLHFLVGIIYCTTRWDMILPKYRQGRRRKSQR